MVEQREQAPVRLVIFGTDAAGKNFVGELIQRRLHQAGIDVAIREQWLCAEDQAPQAKPVEPVQGERKSALSQWAESAFIGLYPAFRWAMMPLADYLIRWDLFRYRYRANDVILISHTAIRLLAFELGHRVDRAEDVVLPPRLVNLLQRMAAVFQADAFVLDIEHSVREARVAEREKHGDSDAFDRYLAKRPELSERIEAIMVQLAQTYFNAQVIENNDLPAEQIIEQVCAHAKGAAHWLQPPAPVSSVTGDTAPEAPLDVDKPSSSPQPQQLLS